MKNNSEIKIWLMGGDPAIRWQTLRDLNGKSDQIIEIERNKIASEGWGARLLSYQDNNGMWAKGLYSPKWISTTYTMLLLRRLGLDPDNPQAIKSCQLLLDKGLYHDGGINYFKSLNYSETCVTGIILSLVSYFNYKDERIHSLTEHLINQQMPDGGWNCDSFKGAKHSSFHTTISVLEGLREYEKRNPEKAAIIKEKQKKGREFLLQHNLYRSHRTGAIFDPRMTRFSFPPRWRYDIMRALDYFQECQAPKDERCSDAIEIIRKKQKPEGYWFLQSKHSGRTYFELEEVGKPSRINTLRALRIMKWWDNK